MASQISVEQLVGLTGGSTPNTITIPSGQTLDVSNATVDYPSGTIVRSGFIDDDVSKSSSSASYVALSSYAEIAPSRSDTKLILIFSGNHRSTSAGAGDMGVVLAPYYYSGTAYTSFPVGQYNGCSPIITSGSNYVTNYDYSTCIIGQLNQSELWSDTNVWAFKMYGSSLYSNTNTAYGWGIQWFEVLA